jgi:di- and tripeptidase
LLNASRHYDVVPASDKDWTSPPFELTSRNGYLYGRGVSDNKGPILAFAHAASDLLRRQNLDIDLVMLIEGEEEADSQGFALTVQKHKVLSCLSVRNGLSDTVCSTKLALWISFS